MSRITRLSRKILCLTVCVIISGGSARADSVLPAYVTSALHQAAAQGPDRLLLSVYDQTLAHPELATVIQDKAVTLQPGLSSKIGEVARSARLAQQSGLPTHLDTLRARAARVRVVSKDPRAAAHTATWVAGGVLAAGAIGAGLALGLSGDSGTSDGAPSGGPSSKDYANEYLRNWGLAAIGASSLYQMGITGTGVKVGVIDSGIDSNFSEFAGRIASGGRNFISGRTPGNIEDTPADGHGTHVSGIIAANRDGQGMQGVAYGSQVLPLRIFETEGSMDYSASESDLVNAIDYGVAQGVKVFNGSYGTRLPNVDVTTMEAEAAAYARAEAAGAILVFSAGNDSWDDPALPAAAPYIKPSNDVEAAAKGIYVNNINSKNYSALASQLLAVVSVDQTGILSSFSNKCGVAAAWCLAAPGGAIYSTVPDNTYATKSGTSMAAPHVAGAVALLLQKYPSLTPAQIVTRILTTARKTGVYGDSLTYGQGMLNLQAASSLIARPLIPISRTATGEAVGLERSVLSLGPAFGDGLTRSLSRQSLTILDSFDRAPIAVHADALARNADLSNRMTDGDSFGRMQKEVLLGDVGETRLAWRDIPASAYGKADKREGRITTAFTADTRVSVGFMEDPSLSLGLVADGTVRVGDMRASGAFLSPYLGFASDGASFATETALSKELTVRSASFSGWREDTRDDRAYGAATEVVYTPFNGALISAQTGFVTEENTFLGAKGHSATALGPAQTTYVGFSGRVGVAPRTALVGSYFLGASHIQSAPGSLVTGMRNVSSDSFALGLLREETLRPGDRLGLVISQPLRIRGGQASLTLPSGVGQDLGVGYAPVTADLTPSGREMDVEMFYATPLSDATSLNASLLYRHQPDHRTDVADEGQALLRLNHTY